MAAWHLVPLETYLTTRYRPDCDYIDGELRGRNSCVSPHSDAVMILSSLLYQSGGEVAMSAGISCRMRISESRYRVADICLFRRGGVDKEAAFVPALCVEVISPEQTLDDMVERVSDYRLLGVPAIWIFDPSRRAAWVLAGETLVPEREAFVALDGKLVVRLDALYAQLDEDWPLAGAEESLADTLAMLEAERQNRPDGWFFSEGTQELFR